MNQANVTFSDLDAVDRTLTESSKNLSDIWARIFAENRLNYRTPRLKRYVAAGTASCGNQTLPVNNAIYCPPDDTIWYDPIFFARLKKVIVARSGQSADAVPVIIIAHEWGHAVSLRLGFLKHSVGTHIENDADCYAGAAIRELIKSSRLTPTALQEAQELFAILGEPNSRATGSFLDILTRSHGVIAERQLSFNFGANSGVNSCKNEARYYDTLRKVQRPTR